MTRKSVPKGSADRSSLSVYMLLRLGRYGMVMDQQTVTMTEQVVMICEKLTAEFSGRLRVA